MTMSVSLPNAKYPWDQQAINFATSCSSECDSCRRSRSAAIAFGRPLSENGMRITFERTDRPPSTPDKRIGRRRSRRDTGLLLDARHSASSLVAACSDTDSA